MGKIQNEPGTACYMYKKVVKTKENQRTSRRKILDLIGGRVEDVTNVYLGEVIERYDEYHWMFEVVPERVGLNLRCILVP